MTRAALAAIGIVLLLCAVACSDPEEVLLPRGMAEGAKRPMSEVLNPGFEEGDNGDWGTSGSGSILLDAPNAHAGSYYGSVSVIHGGVLLDGYLQQQITAASANPRALSFWFQPNYILSSGSVMRIEWGSGHVAVGSPIVPDLLDVEIRAEEYANHGWVQYVSPQIAAPFPAQSTLRITGTWDGPLGDFVGETWRIDDFAIITGVSTVALMLGELAVTDIDELLQAELPTQLTAIETDRGDGIDLLAPEAYFTYPVNLYRGKGAWVETYENLTDFPSVAVDQGEDRATYSMPITVRATHPNRANLTVSQMAMVMRRYSVALYKAIMQNSGMGATVDPAGTGTRAALKQLLVTSYEPSWEFDEETAKIRRIRVVCNVLASCEETPL